MPTSFDGSAAVTAPSDSAGAAFRPQLDRLANGDTEALADVYRAHGDTVYRSAYRLTGNRADAEDVTQEVFLRLRAAVTGFTGTGAQFPAWLRRVAVRQALVHLRTAKRRREVSAEGVMGLLAASDTPLERLSLDAALARLSDEHRTVFLLKEVEGYDHAEIASLCDISVANSEVRLHRARRQLRELLGGSR